jgi:hypothetical protein
MKRPDPLGPSIASDAVWPPRIVPVEAVLAFAGRTEPGHSSNASARSSAMIGAAASVEVREAHRARRVDQRMVDHRLERPRLGPQYSADSRRQRS